MYFSEHMQVFLGRVRQSFRPGSGGAGGGAARLLLVPASYSVLAVLCVSFFGGGRKVGSGSFLVFQSWDRGKLKTGRTSWGCREPWGPWPSSGGCGAGQGRAQQRRGGGSAGCQPGPGTRRRVTRCCCGTLPGVQGAQKRRGTNLGGQGPEEGLLFFRMY